MNGITDWNKLIKSTIAAGSMLLMACSVAVAENEDCDETGPHYGDWSVVSCPSVTNTMSVTPTSICVNPGGGPGSPTVVPPAYSAGEKQRTITYDCADPTNETAGISFSVGGVMWDPPLPGTLTNDFSSTAYVNVTSSDEACPAPGRVDIGSCSWCVAVKTTNCNAAGFVVLTNVVLNPTNGCVGDGFSASVTQQISNAIVVITTHCPCSTNADILVTNTPAPTVVSNWWTVSGPGTFSTNGTGTSASFTPTNCGSGTVTFYVSYKNSAPCDTNTQTTSVSGTFNAIEVTLGSTNIWWFNGENPGGCYNLTTTASVCGAPAGATIEWSISGPASLIGTGSSVTVTSTAASTAKNDVTVKVKVNGGAMCDKKLTVLAPKSLKHLGDADAANGASYRSVITYEIQDQFGKVLPCNVPWNEDIDADGAASNGAAVAAAAISDWAGENWGWGQEDGWVVAPNNAFDTVNRGNPPGRTPVPQNPQVPLGNSKIDHSPAGGSWHVGSTTIGKGVKVKTLKWQIYRDHARHE